MTIHQITNYGVSLVGCGSATPLQIIPNESLSRRVDTNDEWISSRTGIRERRVLGKGESLSDLCISAGSSALKMSGCKADDLDLILVATSTPDDLFGLAPKIQAKLEANQAVAFDITAACSGFLFALITASQYLRTGSMHRALVIGADQLSSWVDWDDRRSCVLFGDGAGAVVLESCDASKDGLIGFELRSDGARGNCLNLPEQRNFEPLVDGYFFQKGSFSPIQMNGQEVYKFAVKEVPSILEKLLAKLQIDPQELDWLLLHQANQRILDAVANRLNVTKEKVLTNLSFYGNTSAATIPLMLDEAVRDGRIQSGDLIASSGFGAGLSWGAALLIWHGRI